MIVARQTGFDRLAPVYDHLSRFFFGNKIQESQSYFLPRIPPGANVLVLGGGTGWIITSICTAQPSSKIWYIDSSREMLKRARKSNLHHKHVTYILGTPGNIPSENFDVIILPFFLDLFSEARLKEILVSILTSASRSARWLITDFVDHGKWWEGFLLKTMYWFFRITCSIEAPGLPAWPALMIDSDFKLLESKSFFNGFIESHWYARN